MPIKTHTKKQKNVKIDPQKYVYQGSPPIMPIKTPKSQNRPSDIRLSGVPPIMSIKPRNKKKTVQIEPQKYVYQGSPI